MIRMTVLVAVILGITPGFSQQATEKSGEKTAEATPKAAKAKPKVRTLAAMAGSESRSFLGIGVREIDSEVASQKKLAEERGVEITKVDEGSAAEKAGLLKGDVVLEFSGQPVQGVTQFVRLVRETPVGRQVSLKVNRDGKLQTVTAKTGSCDNCGTGWFVGGPFNVPMDFTPPDVNVYLPDVPNVYTSWKTPRLGIEGEALSSQLATYFGVKGGVLVRSVTADTPAEKAGLKAGDVIIKVGEAAVAAPRDLSRGLKASRNESVPLTVVRDKREMTVTVTIPELQGKEEIHRTFFGGPAREL